MWHEARRQERRIRGMLVDYRKRAERRRDFYEKIKADPTQFLQVHGRQCKIHLDPAIASAADNAVMMPWQGQTDNLIDRFDVRAHLDYIPAVKKEEEIEITQEERQLNYERYRIIAQNSFLSISEEKFLKQLHLEEQFGYTESKSKKEQKSGGTAIGFNYEEGTAITQPAAGENQEENSDEENSDSDLDVDLSINVSKIDSVQAHEMNKHGRNFGMSGNDFYSFLTNDMEEAETYRLAKEEEHEKALFSGRKSRRERRAHREKRLANRVISPPSYAARESPTCKQLRDDSKSPSRSPSPENTGKITYITSFGDEEEPSSSKPTYADKVKYGKSKSKQMNSDRMVYMRVSTGRRSGSREVSYGRRRRSRSRSRRSRSLSRSRSISRRSISISRRSRSVSRRSGSRSRQTRSRSRRSRSRSRRSRSRSRRSSSLIRRSRDRHGSYTRSIRSYRRRSTSSSSSSSSSKSESLKSVSKSPTKSPIKVESPPKIIPRYYGRKKSDLSSSESSDSDQNQENTNNSDSNKPGYGNSGTATKKTSASLTVIERLKRKRQALLNRQFKKDKIAEELKAEREKQEQQTREDELREMAIRLRKRQREKRHAYDSNRSSDSSRSSSRSKTPSPPGRERSKEKSGSESPSARRSRERRIERGRRLRRSRERDRDRRSRSWSRNRDRSVIRRERDEDDERKDRDRDRDRRDRRSPSPRRMKDREREREREKRRMDRDNKERERRLVDY